MDPKVLFKLHIMLRLGFEELARSLSMYGSSKNEEFLRLIEEMGSVISFAKKNLATDREKVWSVMEDGRLVCENSGASDRLRVGIVTITYDNFRRLLHLQAYVERDEILSIGVDPVIKIGEDIDTIRWHKNGSEDGYFCLTNMNNDWDRRQKTTIVISAVEGK